MLKRYQLLLMVFITIAASVVLFLPVSAQRSTSTPRPTRTPAAQTYYVTGNTINARSCPRTNCEIVTTFSRGASIRVLGSETGTSVSGSTTWYRARYRGQDIYVHSSLVSRTRPSSSSLVQPTRATSNTTSSTTIQPTTVPAAPVAPVIPPTENVSVAPPAASYSCSCSKTCTQMASCDEAYFQLNQCGCGQRDSDGDGVPCESICSGG